MTGRFRLILRLVRNAAVLASAFAFVSKADDPTDERRFAVSTPVVCRQINGYEDYEALAVAELSPDDKLLLYFRPLHYKSRRVGDHFEAHFTQDAKVRRVGQKAPVWSKTNLMDFTAKHESLPEYVFLRNAISLKGYKPGAYELEMTVHDRVGMGSPVIKTVAFRVTAAASAESRPPSKTETPE